MDPYAHKTSEQYSWNREFIAKAKLGGINDKNKFFKIGT